MPELQAMLDAYRKAKHEDRRFMASLKGIDLDEGVKEEVENAFDKIKRRAAAKVAGVSEADIDKRADSDMFGLEFEVEE